VAFANRKGGHRHLCFAPKKEANCSPCSFLFKMILSLILVRRVMRKKSAKKPKAKPAKMSLPAAEIPSAPSPASLATGIRAVQLQMPPLDALLREAEEEPNYRSLASIPCERPSARF
jgi:hypothetical protein